MLSSARLAVAGTFCFLSGCTVFPGLNISAEDREHGHEYHIEKDPNGLAYQVVPGDAVTPGSGVTKLQVIEITPESIAQERELQNKAALNGTLGSINPAVVPPEYRIGPGDLVSVVVWDHPELTNPIGGLTSDPATLGRLVAADGTIFYPYVGVLVVENKTTAMVRTEIADKLKAVIASPQVDVRVVGFRARRVQVFGEVVNPSTINLDDTPKGIIEAIGSSGGLTPLASRRRIYLFRQGNTYLIDFASLLSGQRPGFNPVLMPGDILQIPDQSGDQVFVLGEVGKQAPVIMLQDGMTLTGALTTAGGLDQLTSDDSGVLVFRRPSAADQPPKVFTLDMGNPTGLLLAGEFALEPHDVVYVKRTGFAKYNSLIAQIAPTITAIYQLTYVDYLRRTAP